MADTKITALAAITTVDPANDVLPIVDVSDTSMAASGTTKKITSNQILGAGGTATLASATITGAATAASLTVTGSTIPTNGLYLPTTNTLEFAANSLAQYRIAPLGVFSWYDGAGGTRMTLNSTGLGVGGSPSRKLDIYGTPITIGGTATGMLVTVANSGTAYNASPTSGLALWNKFNSSGSLFPSAAIQAGKENATDGNYAGFLSLYTVDSGGTPNERMRIDSTGNVISNVTGTAPTLATNSQMVFNLTSNTNLRISVRGTDGTTRTADITLA